MKEVKNRFSNHMFFHPQIDEEPEKSRQHVPTSLRMRLLVLLSSNLYDYSIMQTIKDYFYHDNLHHVHEVHDALESVEQPPRKKKKKASSKTNNSLS